VQKNKVQKNKHAIAVLLTFNDFMLTLISIHRVRMRIATPTWLAINTRKPKIQLGLTAHGHMATPRHPRE